MRRTSRPTELWIGDSHAMSFNRRIVMGAFLTGPDGQVILRVGPRLMWSLGTKGFPPRVLKVARLVGRRGVPGAVVPFFVAGEIDVRCHLASHPDETFEFVDTYVQQCRSVSALMGATRTVIVVPPPPCDYSDVDGAVDLDPYRIVGSLDERLRAFRGLRSALAGAVAGHPGVDLLDCTDLLADSAGVMQSDLTDDWCHTNVRGVELVRARVRSCGLAAAGGGGRHRMTIAERG
jgi:hypothetical protein